MKVRVALAVISGIMLGLSFPPFETGVLAVAAFIPFLILFDDIDGYRESFLFSYVTFFVFNLITVYWAGGFTHGKDLYLMAAGAMLIIVHPVFFSIPVLVWTAFRRQFGFKPALFALPFIWVAFEFIHAHSEVSFPWLILGNSQTYDLPVVQFISYTGAYGLSFWLLWLNVLLFVVYAKVAVRDWRPASIQTFASLTGIVLLYLLPKFYGNVVLKNPPATSGKSLRVGVVQPNIDPFEKWQPNSESQITVLQKLTRDAARERAELVLWPETAVPFYLLLPIHQSSFVQIRQQVDSLNIYLLTGIADAVYYQTGEEIPKSSKTSRTGQRYDTFNSSIMLSPNDGEIQKYAKNLLVPFAERVPYSEELSFLNAMQWNFGMGGWNSGREATVFRLKTEALPEVKFSNLICYESVYPGFVADFVKRGAQFLTVITNDSWWGNTSGAYQHKQFGILRAVENRRWIVQCANGGVSCFIDPFGHILHATEMYKEAVVVENIEPKTELTYYSQHGDWLGEACIVVSAFLLAAALGRNFYMNIRRRQMHEVH